MCISYARQAGYRELVRKMAWNQQEFLVQNLLRGHISCILIKGGKCKLWKGIRLTYDIIICPWLNICTCLLKVSLATGGTQGGIIVQQEMVIIWTMVAIEMEIQEI